MRSDELSRPRYAWWDYIRKILVRYPHGEVTPLEATAISTTIEEISQKPNGKEILTIIELVYFKGIRTLRGAAMEVPCSYETAKRWQRNFLISVAEKRGLMK